MLKNISFSEEIERLIFIVILIEPATDNDRWKQLLKLEPSFFCKDIHREIFRSMKNIFANGRKITLATIHNDLMMRNKLKKTGALYLATLIDDFFNE